MYYVLNKRKYDLGRHSPHILLEESSKKDTLDSAKHMAKRISTKKKEAFVVLNAKGDLICIYD